MFQPPFFRNPYAVLDIFLVLLPFFSVFRGGKWHPYPSFYQFTTISLNYIFESLFLVGSTKIWYNMNHQFPIYSLANESSCFHAFAYYIRGVCTLLLQLEHASQLTRAEANKTGTKAKKKKRKKTMRDLSHQDSPSWPNVPLLWMQ